MTKEEQLRSGKTILTYEKGNSMAPLIYSKQLHMLTPTTLEQVQVGDIVYCKVKGKYYTHLVKALDKRRGALIGNNRGGINGWTKQIFGKVIEVYGR